ncbi:MAG: pseG [Proteobacteria bacterium]|nr:pseG [Pseudomonadota bacterium]
MMRVLFRADANTEIGSGHLMRCLALVRALRAHGAECAFLARARGLDALVARIRDEGCTFIPLPGADALRADAGDGLTHSHWLPGGCAADAALCAQALGEVAPADWLVVDHYALDHRWEAAMARYARHVLAIDDLADRRHDCTLLLDQNLMPDAVSRYDGLLSKSCERLLGPRFALLRDEFSLDEAPSCPPGEDGAGRRLLVMFGGADMSNLTAAVAETLISMDWREPVDFVAGPLYPHLDALREAIAHLHGARLHAPAWDVAALMKGACLAIGSPGVSSWERCACALPSITIAQAGNQEPIGRAVAEAGAHVYLGHAGGLDRNRLVAEIDALWSSRQRLREMAGIASAICDGHGAARVAQRMVEHEHHNTMF